MDGPGAKRVTGQDIAHTAAARYVSGLDILNDPVRPDMASLR